MLQTKTITVVDHEATGRIARTVRASLGITPTDVAKAMGLSYRRWHYLEMGKYPTRKMGGKGGGWNKERVEQFIRAIAKLQGWPNSRARAYVATAAKLMKEV